MPITLTCPVHSKTWIATFTGRDAALYMPHVAPGVPLPLPLPASASPEQAHEWAVRRYRAATVITK